jgi:hypothetical protein
MSSQEITMKKNRRTSRLALGAVAAAASLLAGRAEAACDTNGNPSPAGSACYVLKGSDTLFDIMTTAINRARTDGVPGATDLFYGGTGSGNAETRMKSAASSKIGAQSIGPMSRNMRPSILDPGSPDFKKRCQNNTDPGCTADDGYCRNATATPNTVGDACKLSASPSTCVNSTCVNANGGGTADPTATGHAAWAPAAANVVGLDAAVFVVKGGTLENIDFPVFTDTSVPSAFKKAVKNNATLPGAFGDGTAFNNLASTTNYSNIMSVVLSGVDGTGTLKACADPKRVQAIQDLAGYLGVSTMSHLYRRDDNSGTTDTFKDRIMVVDQTDGTKTRYPFTGGRFCNGTAVGSISGSTAQQGICNVDRTKTCYSNAECVSNGGGTVCQFNLNNQDFDPIRRPCVASDSTHVPTSCTDMTTGKPCQASDGNANCTQGFIVALSDNDPSQSDITTSIGFRVRTGDGSVMGYAGREAAVGAKALRVNTIAPADDNVRKSTYLLARRLFIQNTFANSADSNDIPTVDQSSLGQGGGSDQLTKEQSLWGYLSDRTKMDPIVRLYNFIRCASDALGDGGDPAQESGNLCSTVPAAPTPAAYGAYVPAGSFGSYWAVPSGANTGGAVSIDSAGRVWKSDAAGAVTAGTCAGTSLCVSGGTCGAVTAGACPTIAPRALNSPCTLDADCASGLVCGDAFGHSTGGKDGLYCKAP